MIAKLRAVTGAALLLAACGFALAEDYPVRAVRLVIGLAPGAAADLTARVLGRRLSQKFGQTFAVENRPPTGGGSAAELVAHAPKDGYTLPVATPAGVIRRTLAPELTYDFAADFS